VERDLPMLGAVCVGCVERRQRQSRQRTILMAQGTWHGSKIESVNGRNWGFASIAGKELRKLSSSDASHVAGAGLSISRSGEYARGFTERKGGDTNAEVNRVLYTPV